MYISTLNLHGFKSFANKEKLKFGEGITAIVGPNGCGKTNIVDAIRWVLGEQKYSMLRSERMEDIIFSGSSAKKPLNVCEVSLVVHNDKGKLPVEYTDVEITRRIFRNGESQYMLNRTPCRLKDIQNLFIDTGMGADAYSVIELNMVEQILSENAEDRRRMFEEAAGINRYKIQRKSALRKFETIRSDLDRVNDIISEVESKVYGLRLQLKRYDRYAVLSKRLKEKEIELAYLQISQIQSNLKPLRAKITTSKHQLSSNSDEEMTLEITLNDLQKYYREQQGELNSLQNTLNDLLSERQGVNNQVLVLNEQVKSAQRTIERLEIEQEQSSKKIESYKFQIKELNVELESLEPKIGEKSKVYQTRKEEFEQINSLFIETEKKLDYFNSRRMDHLQKVNSTRSMFERTQDIFGEKTSQLENLEEKAITLEASRTKLENAQKEMEKKRNKFQEIVSEDRKNLDAIDSEINKLRMKKHSLSLEFHRIAGQVESLETQLQFYKEIIENREGYPSGVRHVLSNMNRFPDVIGTLADVIQVDDKYRPAIEAGLGTLSQCLVCKTRKSALEMIEEIRNEQVGQVSFIPLDCVPPQGEKGLTLPQNKKILGLASEFIKCSKEVEPLVKFLLKDLAIVENAEAAMSLWDNKSFSGSISDLSGLNYEKSGIITSINGKDELGILGRQEKINTLDREIDALVKKGNKTQEKIQKVDKELVNKEEQQQGLSQKMGHHIDELAEIEKEITHNEFTISQNIESLQNITHQIVTTRQDILNLEKSLEKLTSELNEMEEQQNNYIGKIEEVKKNLQEVKLRRDKENSIIQDLRFELVNLENDRENLQYKIQGMERNIEELGQRKLDLQSEIEKLRLQCDDMTNEIKKAEKTLMKLTAGIKKKTSIKNLKEQAFSETYQQIETLQNKIRNKQRDREKLSEDLKRFELQAVDYERQIDLVRSRIHEKYEVEIPSSMDVKTSEDELELQIDRIERSLERIGPINMAVKDEYDEENKRLEFLQKQRDDLTKSEISLLETMKRIDTEARKQFSNTFSRIRKNFQNTFKLFFEGGEADLQLRGDEDPLEANIAISARPPGKRTQNLRMLSTGEKALTAIALLFAIYQVKPSPYCILDEVDAPLDDNNISKFTRVLKMFSEETQFIIVTHNKLTMEAAKYLYGITMEQSGISKIVSVVFN